MTKHLIICGYFFQTVKEIVRTTDQSYKTLSLTVRPLTVEIKKPSEIGEGGVLTAERRYEVTCESAGSRPPAVVTWYKGKRQLKRITVSVHLLV